MMAHNNIEWLLSLEKRGVKPGLENISLLLGSLGDPQESLRCIHVAGSDGKGSVCAMLESILSASGMRVGLFTTPHILKINECIRLDKADISDDSLDAILGEVRSASEKTSCGCTYFEALTAAAIYHFIHEKTDIAVIEVGMGGRLDATNLVMPEITVINNISLEHTAFLGNTIEEISEEKSGIMKPGVPCITLNSGKALETIKRHAERIGCPLTVVDADDIRVESEDEHSISVWYKNKLYRPNLTGIYQSRNLAIVIETIDSMKDRESIFPFIETGLESVYLHGRLEKIEGTPFIIDVTHTLCGAKCTAESVKNTFGKVTLVIGMLNDKDLNGVSETMSAIASEVIVTSPRSPRAAPAATLADCFMAHRDDVIVNDDISDAIAHAMEIHGGKPILVTGSFRTAEEGYRWLQKRTS